MYTKKMKKVFLALGLVLALSLTLTGCFKSPSDVIGEKVGEAMVEKAIEAGTGGQVDVDTSGGTMNFKSETGDMQVSTGGNVALPENFPKDLIIVDDYKVVMATVSDGNMNVVYETKPAKTELFANYKTKLEADGWKKIFEMDTDTSSMINFEKDMKTASFLISEDGDTTKDMRTMVNVTVAEKK